MICYTFIRQDMEIQHQIVQACHSAREAGAEHNSCEQPPFLILLGIKDGKELRSAERHLERNGIKYHKFYEPDNDLGHTSITTEPLDFCQKELFKKFSLWKFKDSFIPQKESKCS